MLKKSANCVLASFRPSTLRGISRISEGLEGVFPFTKIYYKGERPTRSAVCTSSALHSLRPCWTAFVSILRRDYVQPKLLMHASRSEAGPQPDLCWC
jgi:hypothetical protein